MLKLYIDGYRKHFSTKLSKGLTMSSFTDNTAVAHTKARAPSPSDNYIIDPNERGGEFGSCFYIEEVNPVFRQ